MNNKNKVWLIIFRILTILLFGLIVFLICFDYFDTKAVHLSTEIIVSLIVLLVIVCIDSFDSFQIGNLLNMKKEKNIVEKENKNLKEQNLNLIKMVANINNNVSINFAEVKQATEEDKARELTNNNDKLDINETKCGTTGQLEVETLNKYLHSKNYENATIIRDAKIDLSNPFMKESLIFDLYVKQGTEEEFIEIKYLVPSMYNYFYIYKQLSLIGYYNQINNSNAKYVLVLKDETINANNKIAKLNKQKYEQLLNIFKNQIDKGLMSVIVL